MIKTLTLNPAIDKTVTLASFDPKQMNRAVECHLDPGGKGINVSKVIHALGGQSAALGIVGGFAGNYIEKALTQTGISTHFTEVPGETRTNLKVFCLNTKETIEINESGPVVPIEVLENLKQEMIHSVSHEEICVIAGSTPEGTPQNFYHDLIQALKAAGATVVMDADGALFKSAVTAGPDYIKPNIKELEGYFDKTINLGKDTLQNYKELKACAQHFLDLGVGHVIFSLGSEGAFYRDAHDIYRAYPLKVEAHSSVGAGDAFVGALAHGLDQKRNTVDMLKWAVAASAGAVMTVGTKPADLEWVEAHVAGVIIEKIED